ncbi:NAD-dependent epimerase/dehydratase family protein [Saccharomonospora sp. NPDC006951]
MRVLVTGGSGFLGRAVVAALISHGHEVSTLHRNGDATHQGSVLNPADVTRAVADVEAVCHLAALTKVRESFVRPLDYWSTNTAGTLNVLAALARSGGSETPKRLVLASTAAVYGAPEHQPMDETTPTLPANPYGRTKLAADQAAADAVADGTLSVVSLRAFNIAGAFAGNGDSDQSRIIPRVLAVQQGLQPTLGINGNGDAVRDFVHVTDAADAFALALRSCRPGEWRAYNLGATRATVMDVVRAAEEVTGRTVPLEFNPPANEPPELVADTARIRQELGWQAKNSELTQIVRDAWTALTS